MLACRYPVWTIYGWLFTKLLPFSNVAWRLTVSSVTAGALASGVIALIVSRSSVALNVGFKSRERLPTFDDRLLRSTAGAIAGVTFGFDRAFWRKAVIVDVWPLSVLLFAVTLCLLFRWANQPASRSCFIAACFTFGLTIVNSQAFIPAGFGLLLFVACVEQNIGRDAALVASGLMLLWWTGDKFGLLPGAGLTICETKLLFGAIALLTVGLYTALAIRTGHWLPRGTVLLATLIFLAGLSTYLLVPIFSMANPPVNWGYPRTLEGFEHVLSRGQYEKVQPVKELCIYPRQLWQFGLSTLKSFGVIPTVLALMPLGFLLRIQCPSRRHTVGLLALLVSLSLLLVALLNSPPDRQSTDLVASYFTPAHLVLAILLGHGLVRLGVLLSGTRRIG